MVWSSSSSSVSSSGDTHRANRRNSIFYIDPGFSTKQEVSLPFFFFNFITYFLKLCN